LDQGNAQMEVLGYPLTMVLAEKIVTMLERGEANTRWRDFADVYTVSRHHEVLADDLFGSLHTVSQYRNFPLCPLFPLLSHLPQTAQPKWLPWLRRTNRPELPEQFADLLADIASFADSVLDGTANARTWSPINRQWR
jgi:hypothetical protein